MLILELMEKTLPSTNVNEKSCQSPSHSPCIALGREFHALYLGAGFRTGLHAETYSYVLDYRLMA